MSGTVYLYGIGEDVVRNGLPKDKGEDKPIEGWACGVVEKHREWLGSKTGPHAKESVDGNDRPVVQQSLDLLWVK